MDDVNRKLLDEEIKRIHNKLKLLDPDSEKYEIVSSKLAKLTDLANKDDEVKNRVLIEREQAKSQAELEASKREAESERLKTEIEFTERIEREKLDAEASLEASKRGAEREKFETEVKLREQDAKRTWIQFGISCAVTLATFAGTWIANHISQNQSEYFEATGNAYTSRFGKWQLKEPIHPNPLLRNK